VGKKIAMSGSKIAVMHDTAATLLASGKGILAADENLPVVRERFAAIGLPSSAQKPACISGNAIPHTSHRRFH